MPRFHFNLYGRTLYADPDGEVLPDLSTARQEARRYVDGLAASGKFAGESWHMDVTDTAGALLFRLDLGAGRSPS